MVNAAVHLHAAVAVERVDGEGRAAADRARGDGEVAIDDAAERRVVEDAFELPVVELGLRVALHGILQPPLQVQPASDIVRYCETDEANRLNC